MALLLFVGDITYFLICGEGKVDLSLILENVRLDYVLCRDAHLARFVDKQGEEGLRSIIFATFRVFLFDVLIGLFDEDLRRRRNDLIAYLLLFEILLIVRLPKLRSLRLTAALKTAISHEQILLLLQLAQDHFDSLFSVS